MQVSCYASLDQLPAQATEALSYRQGQPFFASIEWFRCLANHGTDAVTSPRVYLAANAQGPQCALFCAQLQGTRVLVSLTSFYTMQFGPSTLGADAEDGLKAIVAYIADEKPAWDKVDLRYLCDGDAQRDLIVELFAEHGFGTHAYYQYDNWYLDVAGRNFEDYYKGLSSRLRNTIKRKGRKAAREHDLRLQIYPVSHESLDEAIKHYNAIYMRSWKQAEPFPDFMPALFKTCDDLDIVRVGLAWVDEEPAAAQIWINDSGRAVIYKLAYDEKYAPLSIGSLLSKMHFEQAIDADGIHEIDYGVGNEPYKRDWMSDKRTLGGVLACNRRTIKGRFADWRQGLANTLRRLRKSA